MYKPYELLTIIGFSLNYSTVKLRPYCVLNKGYNTLEAYWKGVTWNRGGDREHMLASTLC